MKSDNILPLLLIFFFVIPCFILLLSWQEIPISADSMTPTITATSVDMKDPMAATETPNLLATATSAPISQAATPTDSEPSATSESSATSLPASTPLPPEPVVPIPSVVGGAARP